MEKIRLIDTHTHYAHKVFDHVREDLFKKLSEEHIVAVVEAAIDYDSNKKMLALCSQYPFVYAAVGIHPNCVEELNESRFEELAELLEYEKVIAIGETGLDYSKRNDQEFVELQKKWFRRYIELAVEKQMPLVVHCRDAYDDLIEILSEYRLPEKKGIIHCFSGNAKQAEKLTNMGFVLGIGGKFLLNAEGNCELGEVLKTLSMEHIVLETDAPYLKPSGVPGKRNTSLNLKYIVEKLAELKGVEASFIYETAWNNTLNLYDAIGKKYDLDIKLTGDTHGIFYRLEMWCYENPEVKNGVMVILGDAGINFHGYLKDREKKLRLQALPITLFCVHGNHEMRPEILPDYELTEWHGGRVWVEKEFPNILFAKDGEIYDLNNKKTIVIGGAYSVDKYYRIIHGWPWFEDEQPSEEIKKYVESQLEKNEWNVDVVLSHTAPLKYEPREKFIPGLDQSMVDKSTERWLDWIEDKLSYEHWFCGHYHTQKEIDKIQFLYENYVDFPQ